MVFGIGHEETWVLVTWLDSVHHIVHHILFIGTGFVILIVVFLIGRQMSTGIFKRFFLFMKLTAIFILFGRIHGLLVNYDLVPTIAPDPLSADYFWRSVWSFLLMVSFVALYTDWRNTSLDQPIKPR